jgi:hypothetical protein
MPLSPRSVIFILLLGPLAVASACGGSKSASIPTNPEVINVANHAAASNDDSTCLEPKEVLAGREYTCTNGKKRRGTLVVGQTEKLYVTCSKDNEEGCLTTKDYKSFPQVEREKLVPGNVREGVKVVGVTGTLTFQGPGNCAADGETGCVSTATFPAVEKDRLTPGVLKAGVSLAGLTGDYPSATYALAGATVTADLTSLAASTAAGSYEFFDSAGTRYTGTISDAGAISIGTAVKTFNTSLYRQFTVPGDANLVAGNILSSATILGVAGNVTLPAATVVRTNATFGVNNATSGTLADCSSDGATECVVPSMGTIKAADTANFNGWDIRKKRNQTTGAVLTFAGLAGQSKTCRNRARTSFYDNTTAPAASGLDFFDTIEDINNNVLGLPSQVPAWTMINSTYYGNDFACGGIYATGSVHTGNTGADATLSHDPNGNWQDLTPSILPGGASSSNTSNGCNAADKHCVFKELISGLMVTEVSATTYTWQDAIRYCDDLGKVGGVVTSPIPVIGGSSYSDWRLPTSKEMSQLNIAGTRGLNQTADLATFFGIISNRFWSSTTHGTNNSFIVHVNLGGGGSDYTMKTSSLRLVCVR